MRPSSLEEEEGEIWMFQRGALRSGRYLGGRLVLVFGSLLFGVVGGEGFCFTYSDEVE